MKLFIPVIPMGAVRMTNRGKWKDPNAQRYLDYKQLVGWYANEQMRGIGVHSPIETAVMIQRITFVMPLPKSKCVSHKVKGKLVRRRVLPGEFHIFKPDIDNLFKGVTDSLNGIVWKDDSLICEVGRQLKIYGEKPGIEIEVTSA